MADTSFYDDIKSGASYLIQTGADLYKSSLDAKTAQKANEAAAQVAQSKADDKVMIGNVEISVSKVLAILAVTFGVLFVAKVAKG